MQTQENVNYNFLTEVLMLIAEGLDRSSAIFEVSQTYSFTEVEEELLFDSLTEYFNMH